MGKLRFSCSSIMPAAGNDAERSRPVLQRRSTADAIAEEDLLGTKHLGIYAWVFGVFILAPLMPQKKGGGLFVKIVSAAYNRVGAAGILAIPFASLTLEKTLYDSWCAYNGQSIYEEAEVFDGKGKHGGFPSGGASLPSFSLLQTRGDNERASFRSEWLQSCWSAVAGPSSR